MRLNVTACKDVSCAADGTVRTGCGAGHEFDHPNRLAQIASHLYWVERRHDVQDCQPSVVPPSKSDSMSERMSGRRPEINRAHNLFTFSHGVAPYFVPIANCDLLSP